MIKVGIGFDIHPLAKGRKLILGGVKIPFEKGLAGHSDGDCLIHSIIDGILGASGKGDIGTNFGIRKKKYKNISSILLLKETIKKIENVWNINNIDATIICEKPKLKKFINKMKENIANTLNINKNLINIKSTTTKKIESNAIASIAIVCLLKKS